MKLATWNVNSLKVRLPHVLEFLDRHKPDALCLQEIKLEDPNFPSADFNAAGYQAVFSGQKTYNGVAILSPIGRGRSKRRHSQPRRSAEAGNRGDRERRQSHLRVYPQRRSRRVG